MKPFSLEWWIKQRDMAIHLSSRAAQLDRNDGGGYKRYRTYLRYKKLRDWILQRIINKYGEQL